VLRNGRPVVDSLTSWRWPWFVAWALPGGCFVIGFTALGWYPVLLGLVAAVVLSPSSRRRELLGLIAGAGLAIAYLGSLHTGYQPCNSPMTGQASVVSSCGGIDGPHWLIVGIALAVIAGALYWPRSRARSLNGDTTNNAPSPS
jgi:hypothetical protein